MKEEKFKGSGDFAGAWVRLLVDVEAIEADEVGVASGIPDSSGDIVV